MLFEIAVSCRSKSKTNTHCLKPLLWQKMADENASDLEDGEILDSDSDGEVVEASDQPKACDSHAQSKSRTLKRARESSDDEGYPEHSSASPSAKKTKANSAHDVATLSGGEVRSHSQPLFGFIARFSIFLAGVGSPRGQSCCLLLRKLTTRSRLAALYCFTSFWLPPRITVDWLILNYCCMLRGREKAVTEAAQLYLVFLFVLLFVGCPLYFCIFYVGIPITERRKEKKKETKKNTAQIQKVHTSNLKFWARHACWCCQTHSNTKRLSLSTDTKYAQKKKKKKEK